MSQARSDEERAWFEERVLELLPELYAAAVHLTRDGTDAEDLVADTVARGWAALDSLRDRARLRGWLFRILSNRFASDRRRAAARPAAPEADDEDDTEEFSLFERLHTPVLLWASDPERAFLDRLLGEDLERAIASLPEPFRIAVVLADVQGFAYLEIAEALQIPIGTVRSRLARGRALLQKALWAHACDAGLRPAAPQTSRPPVP